jgi:N-acetyl-gamma-glutamyl-phosphate reductase
MPQDRTRVVIVGAAGYSGAELVWWLLGHPAAQIVGLFGSGRAEKPARIADLFPRLLGRIDMEVRAADVNAIATLKPDAVFLATPHEASVELAPAILARADAAWRPIILDLSGGFRLRDTSLYPKFYGFTHAHPGLLDKAVYGLPELHRTKIKKGGVDLIAVPGCYPTSAILPLAPLARAGAIAKGTRPIIDSISGVSGAGKTPSAKSHFCEVSLQPYSVLKHRHNPEIDLYAGAPVVFTPHLGAYDRGILSTIHVELADGWTNARVTQTLRDAYPNEPFVKLYPPDQWPSVAAVRGTNRCDIGWAVDEPNSHLIVVSGIDNLVKGAAGQAIQCMNIRLGLPETAGLLASDGGAS